MRREGDDMSQPIPGEYSVSQSIPDALGITDFQQNMQNQLDERERRMHEENMRREKQMKLSIDKQKK